MPLLQTLPENEFRQDKIAVDDTKAFFASRSGQMFSAALRGGDPMNHLATPENQMPEHLRNLAIAEKANADGLLGVCKGYRVTLAFMDRLMEFIDSSKKTPAVGGHSARVREVFNPPNQQ